jgi:hypothetical protein
MLPLIPKQINKLGRQIAAKCGKIRKARARKLLGEVSLAMCPTAGSRAVFGQVSNVLREAFGWRAG